MKDYIELCQTTPNDEKCANVGEINYLERSRLEARIYIDQLQRAFGPNPDGTRFKIIQCPHDFGSYHDIKFYYDDENDTHVEYMGEIERGCEKWDEIAITELERQNYFQQMPKPTAKVIPITRAA